MRYFKMTYVLFWLVSISFAQQKIVKTFTSNAQRIEIDTQGLDQITIENSTNNLFEVLLFDENQNSHNISYERQGAFLKFNFRSVVLSAETVFRKFITKRLNRASVILKIPKNREITILGSNIDVISNSYQGILHVYIEKGSVNLHKVYDSAFLKLFKGNIYADISNSSISVETINGKILLNDSVYQGIYTKKRKKSSKIFSVKSIHANVNLNFN